MNRDGRFRSHTKKGPGRFHGQGRMITLRPMLTDIRFVMTPKQRLKPPVATLGIPTQAEHDYCVRATFAFGPVGSPRSKRAIYQLAQNELHQKLQAAQEAKLAPRVIEQTA
jgi:hypothetical protein